MKKYVLLIFIVFLSNLVHAEDSPQMPDYLIYKGDTTLVYSLILEVYLQQTGTPDDGDLFGLKFRGGASLNCWRGYQAIYSIENDSLFLNDIIDCGELYLKKPINKESSQKRLKSIFRSKVKKGKVFIDWYSGGFSLPKGNLLRWDRVFYKSFEKEISIEIETGKVLQIEEVENYVDLPNGINRRYDDKHYEDVFEELKKLNWEELHKVSCDEEYLITIGADGIINKVSMYAYQEEDTINEYWKRKDYNHCLKSIKQGLSKLRFDILKQRGKAIEETLYFELWYDRENKVLTND